PAPPPPPACGGRSPSPVVSATGQERKRRRCVDRRAARRQRARRRRPAGRRPRPVLAPVLYCSLSQPCAWAHGHAGAELSKDRRQERTARGPRRHGRPPMNDRIVVLDGYTTNPGDLDWSPLAALGALEVFDRTPEDLVVQRIGDAPCALLNKTPLTGEMMRALPALRYVGVLATGYNTVDLATARARGITVTNTPAYASVSVAQHAAAMMLD